MRRELRVTRNQNRTRKPPSCELIKESELGKLDPGTLLPGGDHPGPRVPAPASSPDWLHLTRIKVALLPLLPRPCRLFWGVGSAGPQMEIALWLVYADWGMLWPATVATCCSSCFFIYIFFQAEAGALPVLGLEIYAQARAADSYFFAFNKALAAKLLSPPSWGFSAENSICYKMCAAFCISSSKIRDLQFSFRFPAPQSPQSRILSALICGALGSEMRRWSPCHEGNFRGETNFEYPGSFI